MRLREMIRIGKIIGILPPTLEYSARRFPGGAARLTVDFNDPLEQLRQIELSRG